MNESKLIYGEYNSRYTQCSVVGFQLCTMSHCKKYAQQVMPLVRNALTSIEGK